MSGKSKFVIVGTGRSGTTYCQALLRICGVTCTHQQTFTFKNVKSKTWQWHGDGEASFMAVPLLEKIKMKDPATKVVLVKRSPEKVVESWLKLGLFKDDMKTEYPDFYKILKRRFPDVLKGDTPEARAWRYVSAWNIHALKYADHVIHLEELEPEALFIAVGHHDKYDAVLTESISKTINSYKEDARYK